MLHCIGGEGEGCGNCYMLIILSDDLYREHIYHHHVHTYSLKQHLLVIISKVSTCNNLRRDYKLLYVLLSSFFCERELPCLKDFVMVKNNYSRNSSGIHELSLSCFVSRFLLRLPCMQTNYSTFLQSVFFALWHSKFLGKIW